VAIVDIPAARAVTPTMAAVRPLWQVERDAIEAAIQFYDGNIPRAAAALEISPSTIYRKRQAWSDAGPAAAGVA
jgi:two-component system repressor protein LuxO